MNNKTKILKSTFILTLTALFSFITTIPAFSKPSETLSAEKVVYDCTQENDKNLNLICSSYMVGVRDGLLIGLISNSNLNADKKLSANTLINILANYLHGNPLDGDEDSLIVIAKSLKKIGAISLK